MAYINVPEGVPGIRSLVMFRPETGKYLYELAQVLLRGESPLTEAERELIATYVSYLNDCFYCHNSHGEMACYYLAGDRDLVNQVRENYSAAPISDKLKALLQIAGKVQQSGKAVTPDDIDNARDHGATDKDIHDTVLIAAAFCMFNRYVDGLASNTPIDLSTYPLRAKQVAENGYGSHIYAAQ